MEKRRRRRKSYRGRYLDTRKILKQSARWGGEPLILYYRFRRLKKRRVILFCDVSGSMDVNTLTTLQYMHALIHAVPRMEIFFFSTELTCATQWFKNRRFSDAVAGITANVRDWKGGTRIGYCLEKFNKYHSKRLSLSRSIFIIFSDGWDRGDIGLLETQMSIIRRKVYKIVWLNPLIHTTDYQPICRGMRTALPFLDHFLPAGNAADLNHLSALLSTFLFSAPKALIQDRTSYSSEGIRTVPYVQRENNSW